IAASHKLLTVATNASSNSWKLFRLALISTGIGAIVVALGSLVAYLSSSEQAANRFSKILKTVGGIVRELIRYLDRKSVVKGRSVSVRVDLGGRRNIKKK